MQRLLSCQQLLSPLIKFFELSFLCRYVFFKLFSSPFSSIHEYSKECNYPYQLFYTIISSCYLALFNMVLIIPKYERGHKWDKKHFHSDNRDQLPLASAEELLDLAFKKKTESTFPFLNTSLSFTSTLTSYLFSDFSLMYYSLSKIICFCIPLTYLLLHIGNERVVHQSHC